MLWLPALPYQRTRNPRDRCAEPYPQMLLVVSIQYYYYDCAVQPSAISVINVNPARAWYQNPQEPFIAAIQI